MPKFFSSVFTMALGSPRLALEALLVAAVVAGGWMYNRKTEELESARTQAGKLEESLKGKISIVSGQLEILKREKGRVIRERIFTPPEGSIVIKERDYSKLENKYRELLVNLKASKPEDRKAIEKEVENVLEEIKNPVIITVKDRGFTFKPGFGMEWSSKIMPDTRLDFKFAYFKRYSALVGGSKGAVGLSVSRHLDDILWFRPMNIELFGQYNLLRFNNTRWSFGLRSNF
jgi:hypothetical protein